MIKSKQHVMVMLTVVSIYCGLSHFAFAQSFKFASYNVENFWDDIPDNSRPYDEFLPHLSNWYDDRLALVKAKQISKVIALMESPDVIALQEIESGGDRSRCLDILRQEIESLGYHYFSLGKQNDRRVSVTTAFVSKIPFQQQGSLKFKGGPSTRDPHFIEIEWNSIPIRIYNNHWKSKRGKETDSLNARLDASNLVKEDVLQQLQQYPSKAVLLAGDLNADSESKEVKQLPLIDLWTQSETNEPGSHYFKKEWHTLDHIMMSPQILDDAKFQYKRNSFKVIGRDGPASRILLNADGSPFRWQVQKKSGVRTSRQKNFTHLGMGYSDHLPLVAEFGDAEKTDSPSQPKLTDTQDKICPKFQNLSWDVLAKNGSDYIGQCIEVSLKIDGLEKQIFSVKYNQFMMQLIPNPHSPSRKLLYKELKKSFRGKNKIIVKGKLGMQNGLLTFYVSELIRPVFLKEIFKD